MWLKSHHWVDVPHTIYERRRAMRVRESRHTVMLFDKGYYDVDIGKFNTDKLPTLDSENWSDLIDSGENYDGLNHYIRRYRTEEAWFVPKDNDFDEECAREDQIKKEREQREQREREADREGKRLFEEQQRKAQERAKEEAQRREREAYIAAENRARLDRELEESQARSDAYAKQLAEVEARIKAQHQVRARIAHEKQYGANVCNIRPNKWIPK